MKEIIINISIDLVLIIVNLLALAFSYGKFSEKMLTLEKRISEISTFLTSMEIRYFTSKEGNILEKRMDTIGDKLDNHPCMRCVNFKETIMVKQ